eukprot:CAMPEP_0204862926 /NCGR_PEP_ID=MMETSP1348-20121228/2932_1 /ASSEMBLY_ACC=CAM_ASM_000700 /TAXON_ID=215587 /ORGANISM="Aplanochytrium stocchinoi, Strain GSBS06" /LENGTH=212 /DNA_ID=CAMNT_0052013103 /DNA_START=32 /DNA_END=670 /DNA_ORIENTATION=-
MDVAPYPAGLNDCYSGLKYMYENATKYNIDPKAICVAGESGGGNLAISTALKCKKEGTLHYIPKGFYALCPYIAGIWPQTVQNEGILGTSHLWAQNNGKFISLPGDTNAAIGYSIEAFRNRDPMAWPGFATIKDLAGLPRCIISVNECDPLRDEGIIFYRRLLKANVPARCREVIGTPHGGDLLARVVPDIALETAQSIGNFLKGDAELSKL